MTLGTDQQILAHNELWRQARLLGGTIMAVDWTISVGSLVQIVVIFIGRLSVLITLRNTVTGLKDVTSIQYELRQMAS
jgi:hypothetical protein